MSPPLEQSTKLWPVTTLIAGAILLLGAANVGELQLDAPMYAFFSKRVATTGDWTTLYYDWAGEHPYFRKPPVMFWLTALLMQVAGQGVWVTRVVPALFFLIGALLLARLVRKQYSATIAWTAAAALVVQREVLSNVLEVRMDGGLIVTSLIASYGIYRLITDHNSRWKGFLILGTGLGLGLMVRGGLALFALPAALIAVVITRRLRVLLSIPGWLMLIAAILLLAGPWYGWQHWRWGEAAATERYADTVQQHLAVSAKGFDHLVLYYIKRLPEVYFLWLLPAIAGAWALWRRRSLGPVDVIALSWLPVVFLLIHFTAIRAPQYLLQMFPWLGLLAAIGLVEGHQAIGRWWSRFGPFILPTLAALLLALTAIPDKGIAKQTTPEIRRAAKLMQSQVGHSFSQPPPTHPIVWIPAKKQSEWARLDLVGFHTNLSTKVRLADEPMTPGDYIVHFFAHRDETLTLEGYTLHELDRGLRTVIYRVVDANTSSRFPLLQEDK